MDGTTIVDQGLVVDRGWQIVGSHDATAAQSAATGNAFGFADIAAGSAAAQATISMDAVIVGAGAETAAPWLHGMTPLYDPAATLHG